MKISAFLAMTFWTVKTFIELKLDFVSVEIIPSRYLKLTNPANSRFLFTEDDV